MKSLTFSQDALRTLRRMPVNTAKGIKGKIEQYGEDHGSLANNVVKLQGRDALRLRVGDWRIIFEEDDATVHIVDVGPRGGVYD